MAREIAPAFTAEANAMLATVDAWTRDRLDLAHLVYVAADAIGYPVADFADADGNYIWELAADIAVYGGYTTVDAVNRRGKELADARWAASKKREAAEDLAESEYDFHVQAYGRDGQGLMDTAPFSDMGMYASMKTEAEADAWAANAFATDARVHSVGVSIYRRSWRTVSWVFHRGVKTIHRPAAAA